MDIEYSEYITTVKNCFKLSDKEIKELKNQNLKLKKEAKNKYMEK